MTRIIGIIVETVLVAAAVLQVATMLWLRRPDEKRVLWKVRRRGPEGQSHQQEERCHTQCQRKLRLVRQSRSSRSGGSAAVHRVRCRSSHRWCPTVDDVGVDDLGGPRSSVGRDPSVSSSSGSNGGRDRDELPSAVQNEVGSDRHGSRAVEQ